MRRSTTGAAQLGTVALVALCFAGCGSDSDSNPSSSGGSGGNGGVGAGAAGASAAGHGGSGAGSGGAAGGANQEPATIGSFVIELKPNQSGSGTTTVAGTVNDGATPEAFVWSSLGKSGACELLKPTPPFCETPCGADVCTVGDRCVPYPKAISVGDVRVQGVGAAEFTMQPRSDSKAYTPPDAVTVPYPPAADGAPIRVDAAGGEVGAFTLQTQAIAPLVVTSSNPADIVTGSPLRITWTPGQNNAARIHVELDLSHHGGTKGKLVCDAPDNGTLELPASLLTELIGLGVSGFPTIEIARRSVGSASVPQGVIELLVVSQTRLDVTVPGLTSCSGDEECPTGQTCQMDLQCK